MDLHLQTTASGGPSNTPVSAVPAPEANERLCAALDEALADAFDHCLDTLFYTASAASNEARHIRCIETVRELRLKQPAISAAFVAQIRELLEAPAAISVVIPFMPLQSAQTGRRELVNTLKLILERADVRDAEARERGELCGPAQALTTRRLVELLVRCGDELQIECGHLLLLLEAFEHTVIARLPALRAGQDPRSSRALARASGSSASLRTAVTLTGRGVENECVFDDDEETALQSNAATPEFAEVSRLMARFKLGGLKLPHASASGYCTDTANNGADTAAELTAIDQPAMKPSGRWAIPAHKILAVIALVALTSLAVVYFGTSEPPSGAQDSAILSAEAEQHTGDATGKDDTIESAIPDEPVSALEPIAATAPVTAAEPALPAAPHPAMSTSATAPSSAMQSTAAPVEMETLIHAIQVDERLSQQAQYLLGRAEQALQERRLTTPFEDSAWANYLAVLVIDRNDARAQAGLQRIVEIYRLLIRNALRRGERERASEFLSRIQSVAPDAPELDSLRQEILAAH